MKQTPKFISTLCMLASAGAWAALGISVSPAAPTSTDTIVLEITGGTRCPLNNVLSPPEMIGGQVIRIPYDEPPTAEPCQNPGPLRLTIGRLPVGRYAIEVVSERIGAANPTVSAPLVIDFPSVGHENSGGHWLTGTDGEGVFVTQYGSTAFISFLSIGSDGKPTWAVMPNARWTNPGMPLLPWAFVGDVWRVENQGGRQVLTRLGRGEFTALANLDRARFTIFQDPGVISRELLRYRF